MLSNINVGIPLVGSTIWLGGVSYIEHLVKAVYTLPRDERPNLFLIITADTILNITLHEAIIPLFDGIIFVGDHQVELPTGIIKMATYQDLFKYLDFYYPVLSDVWPGTRAASWIPDFQHFHLPQFFSNEELRSRTESFSKIANHAQMIVFSSNDALGDFRHYFAQSDAITCVLPFYALPQETWYVDDPRAVQVRYGLPDNILLCCNQFWAHKNHTLLFEAIAALHSQQIDIHLVCTGSTSDYRDAGYFQRLTDLVTTLGIEHLVHILGNIPRQDQIQLIRRSMAVVQPSLFEGWSTVVEDCRVLGKTIILSDLPVHHEQAPRYGAYFDRTSSASLAKVILEILPEFQAGPDERRERQAREESFELAYVFGRRFCEIVRESLHLPFGGPRQTSPELANILTESHFEQHCYGSTQDTETEPLAYRQASNPQVSKKECRPKTTIVSAIVSTYNSERFIRGCLEDLISQTLFAKGQMEIIVVDSGSLQDEVKIVREFQQRYPHIKYVRTERETLYAAWNRGIGLASGKYLTNANTDDRHRADALEVMCRALDAHAEIELVYSDCYVSATVNETFEESNKQILYRYLAFFPPCALLHYQFGPQPMWRKSVHDKIGYFDTSFKAAGDYDFNIRFALAGCRALHISAPLGLYLEHQNALSFKDNTAVLENHRIKERYRTLDCIEWLYRQSNVPANNNEDKACICLDLGIRSLEFYPPWNCGKSEADLDFALQCLRTACSFLPVWPPLWDVQSASRFVKGSSSTRSLYEAFLVKLPPYLKMKLLSNGML